MVMITKRTLGLSSFFQWWILSIVYEAEFQKTCDFLEVNNIIYIHKSLFDYANISFNLISQKVHDNVP